MRTEEAVRAAEALDENTRCMIGSRILAGATIDIVCADFLLPPEVVGVIYSWLRMDCGYKKANRARKRRDEYLYRQDWNRRRPKRKKRERYAARVVELYGAGWHMKEIASELGIDHRTVRAALDLAGVRRRPRAAPRSI